MGSGVPTYLPAYLVCTGSPVGQDGARGGKRNRTAAGWGLGLGAISLALVRASEKSKNFQLNLASKW